MDKRLLSGFSKGACPILRRSGTGRREREGKLGDEMRFGREEQTYKRQVQLPGGDVHRIVCPGTVQRAACMPGKAEEAGGEGRRTVRLRTCGESRCRCLAATFPLQAAVQHAGGSWGRCRARCGLPADGRAGLREHRTQGWSVVHSTDSMCGDVFLSSTDT